MPSCKGTIQAHDPVDNINLYDHPIFHNQFHHTGELRFFFDSMIFDLAACQVIMINSLNCSSFSVSSVEESGQ